jgi:serine/threonine protein kinase/tetratricopeptide (TPR) repeat protein
MNARCPSLDDIFFAAREVKDAEDREAYLERVCGEHTDLRRRVERLLNAQSKIGSFLESPAPAPTVVLGEEAFTEGPGLSIGPYKLLESIGEGGMGTVFMAEQSQPVRRRVALKVIKPGMDTKQVIARFEAERQALALMDHPNIARVLDAGATESGRPYFVMELVRGIPITEYCHRERLSIAERLELFVLVCRAVQHAHQKGIIHRDLKPSNILVTVIDGAAVPKVIDFGVAKATGQSLTDRTLYTGFQQFVGTPLYMSPEQADVSGVDVDTRSDIYSLGVLLYELLTGTTPFDQETLRNAAFDEMRRIIREDEPPRPSTRLSSLGDTLTTVSANRKLDARHLDRTVRGELDWIVMKALEKDRRRRYETANDFAADVMRYLSDQPVEACPPSWGYTANKYARRHRRTLATAAAFVLLLVSAVVVSTWQAVRATVAAGRERQANEKAQQRLIQLEKANDILGSIFKDLDPGTDEKESRSLRAQFGERLDHATEEIAAGAVGDPLAVAKLQLTLGKCQRGLGYVEKAITLFTQAHATFLAEAGPGHPDAIDCVDGLFDVYWKAMRLREVVPWFEEMARLAAARLGKEHPATMSYMNILGWVYHYVNRLDESISVLEETVKLRTAVLGQEHRDTLKSMNALAMVYRGARKLDKSVPLFERTFVLQKATLGPDHSDTLHSMHHLAWAYLMAGKSDEGVRLFEEELELRKAKSGPRHPRTLNCMNDLAIVYGDTGRQQQSLRMNEEVYSLRRAIFGADHPDTLSTMGNLANSYEHFGRLDEALNLREQALDFARSKWGLKNQTTLNLMQNLGGAYLGADRLDRAIPLLKESLELEKATRGHQRNEFDLMTRLALAYQMIGKHNEALPLDEAAFKLSETMPEKNTDLFLSSARHLASAYRLVGQPDRAVSFLKEQLAEGKAKVGPADPVLLGFMADFAQEYRLQGKPAETVSMAEEVYRSARDHLGPDDLRSLSYMCLLALRLRQSGRHDKAVPLLEAALRLSDARWGREHEYRYDRLDSLAQAYLEAHRLDDAVRLFREMLAIYRRKNGGDKTWLATVLSQVGRNLVQAGHAAEAEPLLREALTIRDQMIPNDWTNFETRSLLGDALREQKKYVEAEPLLLQGYEGIRRRRFHYFEFEGAKPWADAAGRLVRLYEAWGKPEQAEDWRRRTGLMSPELPDDVFALLRSD